MKSILLFFASTGLQIKKLLIISLMISPVTWIIDKLAEWHIDNSDYVAFVIGAITIDHLLGSIYHAFYAKDWRVKKNLTGLLVKMIIVVSVGYLFEGLDTLMVKESILKEYSVMVLRLMVFLYPASSAFNNSYIMTGKKFPPVPFMDKLKKFSENATLNVK